MIAAGESRRPGGGLAVSASPPVVGAELGAAAPTEAQFAGHGGEVPVAGADCGQEVPDQGCGNPVGEREFFMARKPAERWIFRLETDTGQG